jgi:hypothetical protein
MEVARLWDGKVITQPDAANVTKTYYYAATRGGGLWRRILPEGNTAPTVSITSPLSGSTFSQGSTVSIQANASDADGTIAKVEFFQGATKLGEDLSSPYTFNWSNVSVGNYSVHPLHLQA